MNLSLKAYFLLITMSVFASAFKCYATEPVAYPEGYRYWTHVKTAILDESHPLFNEFGGIHSIYANAKALKALQGNSSYADGSVFVFDLAITEPFPGGLGEGKRLRLDVMQKDSVTYASTGGWGYASFPAGTDSPIEQNVVERCHSCHLSQDEKDFVFSEFRP